MKKSEKYRMAIVAVMDAYNKDYCTTDDTIETLMELFNAYSTARWHEERKEPANDG